MSGIFELELSMIASKMVESESLEYNDFNLFYELMLNPQYLSFVYLLNLRRGGISLISIHPFLWRFLRWSTGASCNNLGYQG